LFVKTAAPTFCWIQIKRIKAVRLGTFWRISMANFQPLHKETHKDVKITQPKSVADLKEQHALGVVVQEFALAGAHYPIAFVKPQESGNCFPVVILGLEQNKNLFVTDEGKWDGMYMPARYTHKPLSVIPNPEDENMYGIAINMDSEVVSTEEGEALFDESGEESEYLGKRKQALMSYVEQEHVTKMFAEELDKLGLLHSQNINVKVQGKEYNLNGLYMVDENKMSELSDEEFLSLRKRGFLAAIYAHLSSMHQVNSLIRKQAEVLKAAE
jgi:hypothetical protein